MRAISASRSAFFLAKLSSVFSSVIVALDSTRFTASGVGRGGGVKFGGGDGGVKLGGGPGGVIDGTEGLPSSPLSPVSPLDPFESSGAEDVMDAFPSALGCTKGAGTGSRTGCSKRFSFTRA